MEEIYDGVTTMEQIHHKANTKEQRSLQRVSTFPEHQESRNFRLSAANINISNSETVKLWMICHPEDRPLYDQFRRKYGGGYFAECDAVGSVHKNYIPFLPAALDQGIRFLFYFQYPGEIMINGSQDLHHGFTWGHGEEICATCNYSYYPSQSFANDVLQRVTFFHYKIELFRQIRENGKDFDDRPGKDKGCQICDYKDFHQLYVEARISSLQGRKITAAISELIGNLPKAALPITTIQLLLLAGSGTAPSSMPPMSSSFTATATGPSSIPSIPSRPSIPRTATSFTAITAPITAFTAPITALTASGTGPSSIPPSLNAPFTAPTTSFNGAGAASSIPSIPSIPSRPRTTTSFTAITAPITAFTATGTDTRPSSMPIIVGPISDLPPFPILQQSPMHIDNDHHNHNEPPKPPPPLQHSHDTLQLHPSYGASTDTIIVNGRIYKMQSEEPNIISGESPQDWKCDQCPSKTFTSRKQWYQHVNNHKNKRIGKYQCEHCGHKCGRKANLNEHLYYHHNQNHDYDHLGKYKCQKCGKKWPNNTHFKSHERNCKTTMKEIRDQNRAKKRKDKRRKKRDRNYENESES